MFLSRPDVSRALCSSVICLSHLEFFAGEVTVRTHSGVMGRAELVSSFQFSVVHELLEAR